MEKDTSNVWHTTTTTTLKVVVEQHDNTVGVSLTPTFVGCELLGGNCIRAIEVAQTKGLYLYKAKRKIIKMGGI